MMRALNTILVVTLFAGLLAGIAVTLRQSMRGIERGVTANFGHRHQVEPAKPAPAEAAVGFGHGILRH